MLIWVNKCLHRDKKNNKEMGPFICCYFGSRPVYAYSSSSLHKKNPQKTLSKFFLPLANPIKIDTLDSMAQVISFHMVLSSHQWFIEQLEKRSVSNPCSFLGLCLRNPDLRRTMSFQEGLWAWKNKYRNTRILGQAQSHFISGRPGHIVGLSGGCPRQQHTSPEQGELLCNASVTS